MRALLALLAVIAILATGHRLLAEDRIDEIGDRIPWPSGCAEIARDEPSRNLDARSWRPAESATLICQAAGPSLTYVRFADRDALRTATRRRPPSQAICLIGREALLDGLGAGQFERLCGELKGDRIDELREVRPPTGGRSSDEIDRSVRRYERRARAAQGRALERYWARAAAPGTS